MYIVVPAGRDPSEFDPVPLSNLPSGWTYHGPHAARLEPGGDPTWAQDERGLFEVYCVAQDGVVGGGLGRSRWAGLLPKMRRGRR